MDARRLDLRDIPSSRGCRLAIRVLTLSTTVESPRLGQAPFRFPARELERQESYGRLSQALASPSGRQGSLQIVKSNNPRDAPGPVHDGISMMVLGKLLHVLERFGHGHVAGN